MDVLLARAGCNQRSNSIHTMYRFLIQEAGHTHDSCALGLHDRVESWLPDKARWLNTVE